MSELQELVKKHDSENFLQWLEEFPVQVRESVDLARRQDFGRYEVNKIILGGMGGSGITGDLLTAYTRPELSVPLQVKRHYELPGWVDEQTLFIGVSYSGNTEETLAMFREAHHRGASCLLITSDGQMEEIAREKGYKYINIPAGQPPRASAGYLFIPLLFALESSGFAAVPGEEEIDEAIALLEKQVMEFAPSAADNRAHYLAKKIQDCLPLLYGGQVLTAPLALRFKNQLNENAKMMAIANELPELNHNEIMGWESISDFDDSCGVFMLRDGQEQARVNKRFQISREILEEKVDFVEEIHSRGKGRFARFLTSMLATDYISYYAALLRKEDPSDISSIELLKEKLK